MRCFLPILIFAACSGMAHAQLDSGGGRSMVGNLQAHSSLGSPFETSAVTAGMLDVIFPMTSQPDHGRNENSGVNGGGGYSPGSSGGSSASGIPGKSGGEKAGQAKNVKKSAPNKQSAKKSSVTNKSAEKSSAKKTQTSKVKKTKSKNFKNSKQK